MIKRTGTVYLQLAPSTRWYADLRLVNATSRKPRRAAPGAVVVKLRVEIPGEAFEPLTPEATVTVPESLVQRPIAVEAEDPE